VGKCCIRKNGRTLFDRPKPQWAVVLLEEEEEEEYVTNPRKNV